MHCTRARPIKPCHAFARRIYDSRWGSNVSSHCGTALDGCNASSSPARRVVSTLALQGSEFRYIARCLRPDASRRPLDFHSTPAAVGPGSCLASCRDAATVVPSGAWYRGTARPPVPRSCYRGTEGRAPVHGSHMSLQPSAPSHRGRAWSASCGSPIERRPKDGIEVPFTPHADRWRDGARPCYEPAMHRRSTTGSPSRTSCHTSSSPLPFGGRSVPRHAS